MSLANSKELKFMVENDLIEDVSIRFGIIGAGQKGNKDADLFAGYEFYDRSKIYPTLAVNFAKNDMLHLKNIPEKFRLHFNGFKGAARTPSLVVESFDPEINPDAPRMLQQLTDAMQEAFTENGELTVEHIIITAGSGGGFGTGFLILCLKLMQESFFPVPVSFLLSNPADDPEEKRNAIVLGSEINSFQKFQRELFENGDITSKPLGSIIMTDNRHVIDIYNKKGEASNWKSGGNDEVVSTIHEFNVIPANLGSDNATYDATDLNKLFTENGGFVSLHKATIDAPFAEEVVKDRVKRSIEKGIFAASHHYENATHMGLFVLRPGFEDSFKDIEKNEQTLLSTLLTYNDTAEYKYGDPIWTEKYAVVYTVFAGMNLPDLLLQLNEEFEETLKKRETIIKQASEKELNIQTALNSVKSSTFKKFNEPKKGFSAPSSFNSTLFNAFSRSNDEPVDQVVKKDTPTKPKSFGAQNNDEAKDNPWAKFKKQ